MSSNAIDTRRASTGVVGLDQILGGGLTPSRMYLFEGAPGTGKTTFALRFLMSGVAAGEPGLYITLSETASELRAVVDSHGWSLDGIEVHELGHELGVGPSTQQTILHPSEIELGETISAVIEEIEARNPGRVVFDSLSEMRLLAQDPLRYRRQILALKQFFSTRACTVLLLDDKTSDPTDLQLHSIAHGVISLDSSTQMFGAERRHLRVSKMRGMKFQGGVHDFSLDTGRVEVFPRLVAAEHHVTFDLKPKTSGSAELDTMLGGGLVPGSNALLLGPSGIGKTSTAARCVLAALERGERAHYYLFDEGLNTFLGRCRTLGIDLQRHLDSGLLTVAQIDPAAMSPGEFANGVMHAVLDLDCKFVVIDSLNAYMLAMPGQAFLLLHMHELLNFLNQRGVITMLVVGQHGLIGDVRSDIDLSYLSDSIVLFRFFEAKGEVRAAISVLKSRTGASQRGIRELRLSSRKGVQIGAALEGFDGILSGLTSYRGSTALLVDDAA
ncbi:MAG: circadian clock protein KaiC [Pseudomonadota bacterium]|nr:circadian clock protein KaiC [Pseudomonadota bacterium]